MWIFVYILWTNIQKCIFCQKEKKKIITLTIFNNVFKNVFKVTFRWPCLSSVAAITTDVKQLSWGFLRPLDATFHCDHSSHHCCSQIEPIHGRRPLQIVDIVCYKCVGESVRMCVLCSGNASPRYQPCPWTTRNTSRHLFTAKGHYSLLWPSSTTV